MVMRISEQFGVDPGSKLFGTFSPLSRTEEKMEGDRLPPECSKQVPRARHNARHRVLLAAVEQDAEERRLAHDEAARARDGLRSEAAKAYVFSRFCLATG